MKKFLALFVALVLAVSAIPLVFAADELTFTVGSITVNKGERFNIPVTVTNNYDGIIGTNLRMSYAEGLSVNKIAKGSDFAEISLTPGGTLTANPLGIVFDGLEPSWDEEGELVNIYFNPVNVAGRYTISLTDDGTFDESGLDTKVPLSTLTLPGTITVNDAPARLDFKGAQVRIAGGEYQQGLRFVFTIDKDFYNELDTKGILPDSSTDTGVGFGAVVFPKDALDKADISDLEKTSKYKKTNKAKVVPAVKLFGEDGDKYTYTACMVGITEEYYATEYVAVPYATYMDGNSEITIYGTQTEPISVFDIADKAYQAGTEKSEVLEYLYENILVKVDASYEK